MIVLTTSQPLTCVWPLDLLVGFGRKMPRSERGLLSEPQVMPRVLRATLLVPLLTLPWQQYGTSPVQCKIMKTYWGHK